MSKHSQRGCSALRHPHSVTVIPDLIWNPWLNAFQPKYSISNAFLRGCSAPLAKPPYFDKHFRPQVQGRPRPRPWRPQPHGDTPWPRKRPDGVWSCPWTSCPEPQTGRTSCPAKNIHYDSLYRLGHSHPIVSTPRRCHSGLDPESSIFFTFTCRNKAWGDA